MYSFLVNILTLYVEVNSKGTGVEIFKMCLEVKQHRASATEASLSGVPAPAASDSW